MATVTLAPDGATVEPTGPAPVRRVLLPVAALTTAAARAGVPLSEVAFDAAPAGACRLAVELDLGLTGSGTRLHAWQRWHDGHVTSVATALGSRVELASYDDAHWQAELVRALRMPLLPDPPTPPARVVELPLDLLLGTGEALARPDVYDELVARAAGAVRADGCVLDLVSTHTQLRRLHGSVLARLLVVGSGRRGGASRIGWVSWLLFADGWRALMPRHAGAGGARRAMVRLEPRRPEDLGVEVARWVSGVRS